MDRETINWICLITFAIGCFTFGVTLGHSDILNDLAFSIFRNFDYRRIVTVFVSCIGVASWSLFIITLFALDGEEKWNRFLVMIAMIQPVKNLSTHVTETRVLGPIKGHVDIIERRRLRKNEVCWYFCELARTERTNSKHQTKMGLFSTRELQKRLSRTKEVQKPLCIEGVCLSV